MAVGDFTFVDKVKSELGFKTVHRRLTEVTGMYTLEKIVNLTAPILPPKVTP